VYAKVKASQAFPERLFRWMRAKKVFLKKKNNINNFSQQKTKKAEQKNPITDQFDRSLAKCIKINQKSNHKKVQKTKRTICFAKY